MVPAYREPAAVPAPPPPPEDRYLAAWRVLRARRIRRWIAFFAWAPLALGALRVVAAIGGQPASETAWPYVAIAFASIAMVFVAAPSVFRCPRCHEPFERGRFIHSAFTGRCLHCGLAAGTPARASGSRASDGS